MTATYLQLHETGVAMMKKALDKKGHDHIHAKKVQNNAEMILHELQQTSPEKYQINAIENMVITAAWWHDCYKRMHKNFSFYAILNEGQEAEKIFLANEQTVQLAQEEREQIAHAIRYHHQPYRFMFNWRGMPPVTRILLEADGVETFNVKKFPYLLKKAKNIFVFLLYLFLFMGLISFYFLMPLSKAARKIYWQNLFGKS